RNLKLRDEDGIVSIPDTELFENLTLMGYNISQNQKLTFQKGQFSHQWKYLIHTIMQCLSPKSTGFNEFSSNIVIALVCLATNRTYKFSKMIFDGEGSGTPTEPHHTPFPEAKTSHLTTSSIPLPSIPTALIPPVTQPDTTPIRQYTRRARIAQSSAFPTIADSEHNVDFHPMVDFVVASPLRYALTFKPIVYVSHIRQFWSTARIETTEEGTKILATVDGILRTVTESSLRRNLKLQDEEGISSLPDTNLFENLTLMGYNISPNQKFTFQKGQFFHQWKYLIHTIMQCLSPKSTGFNEFSSNIATTLVCLATNMTYNFSKVIFDGLVKNVNNKVSKFLMYPRFLTMCLRMSQFGKITHTHTYEVPFHTRKLLTTLRVNSPSFLGRTVLLFATMLVPQGEGSGTPTKPYHTPSPEAQQPSHTTLSSPTIPSVSTVSIPPVTSSDTPPIRQYTRRTRIAQSSVLPPVADEPASPFRDVSQWEACPTNFGFIADQDRATIDKSSTLPYDSAPRVTSYAAAKGSMQQTINELTALCTSLQRKHSYMVVKFEAQKLEITRLKARVKILEDREGVVAEGSGDDAPIKGRNLDEGEAAAERSNWREDQRMSEQIARDAEVARIHVEEELQKLPLERRIELISDLVRYQDNYAKESAKKFKPSDEVLEEVKSHDEVPEEKVKEMMQLVPIEEVYVEALQVKHPIID
nr:hypothetical protein [Tanacetum cinerariifolium]